MEVNMGVTFATMPWYLDILSFLLLGSFLAFIFAVIPAVAGGGLVANNELRVHRLEYYIFVASTIIAVIGGYVLAGLILGGVVG